ncbi:MAG: type II/IV secretion system protein, partial [Alphaproteobacteria bacterium]|nr:type II/IV secretion system protein [Alphaproteobacteria bacterium]
CFAQRLVRKLCQGCKQSYQASPEECKLLGAAPASPPTLYKGVGCKECNNSGFKGRVGIHEILYIDEEIETILAANGHKHEMKAVAIKNGFKSMRDDGIMKVYDGLISLDGLTKSINFSDRM